jgi:hypothetical protein
MESIMPEKPPVQKLRRDQYHRPDISADQTCRVGQIIVAWSKLEAAMEDTIWMFLDLDEEDGKIVTTRLSADAKAQMLRFLGQRHIANDDLRNQFRKALAYVDEIKDVRNFIAHGVWGTLMPEDIPVALSIKAKSDTGEVISETFSRKRMEETLAGIQKTIRYLVALPEKLGKPRRVPLELR